MLEDSIAKGSEKRERQIQMKFFVTEQEKKLIKQRMMRYKLTNFSNYARYMLLSGEIKVVEFDEVRELRVALNRLGVNLNQIAKRVNENDQASYDDTRQALKVLADVKDMVMAFITEQIDKETGGLS